MTFPSWVKVRCEVDKGLTKQEYIVRLKGKDGSSYETWADKREVDIQSSSTATVAVRAIEGSQDSALIELPNESMVGGRRVWVAMSSIVQ
jgi:hypothetical protein